MKHFLSKAVTLFTLISSTALSAEPALELRRSDSLALVSIRRENRDSSWLVNTENYYRWADKYPLERWQGVKLENNRVVSLKIDSCKITKIPREISNLTALRSLNLNKNRIVSLPETIGSIPTLETLKLEYCSLEKIPESIGNLTGLTYLSLYRNKLSSLPEQIGNCTSLQRLSLSFNELSTLPTTFAALQELTLLGIGGNQFTELPALLGELKKLNSLAANRNELTTLPESFSQLTALRTLNLEDNLFTEFPQSITALDSLERLYLGGISGSNSITDLPPSISGMKSLTSLNLTKNELVTLPDEITDLVNLQSLVLMTNKLESFPPNMKKLTKLRELNIPSNRLHFDDIEYLLKELGEAPLFANTNPLYLGQRSVPIEISPDSTLLTVTIGGAANGYNWYSNGKFIFNGVYDTLRVTPEELRTNRYHCVVYNRSVDRLTIKTDTVGTAAVSLSKEVAPVKSSSLTVNDHTIQLTVSAAAKASVTILDMKGRVVQYQNLSLKKGVNQLNIERGLSRGIYILSVKSADLQLKQLFSL